MALERIGPSERTFIIRIDTAQCPNPDAVMEVLSIIPGVEILPDSPNLRRVKTIRGGELPEQDIVKNAFLAALRKHSIQEIALECNVGKTTLYRCLNENRRLQPNTIRNLEAGLTRLNQE